MTIKDLKEFVQIREDLEPITPRLVKELRKKGQNITDDDLRLFKSEGFKYNRKRDSFIGPMISSFDEN